LLRLWFRLLALTLAFHIANVLVVVVTALRHNRAYGWFGSTLRSMTSGRGTFTMQFEKYMPVNQSIAEKVLKGQA
jgi:translation elongation factor EF-G